MKVEHIKPFVLSTIDVFESMMDTSVKAGKVVKCTGEADSQNLIGIIGLSGTAKGTVALKFPEKTALSIVGAMIGDKIETFDSSVVDGIGELVNIIAGKAKLNMLDHKLSMSLPTVIRGSIYNTSGPDRSDWYEIPFTSNLGNFSLSVTFKTSTVKVKEEVCESTGC